MEESPLPDYQSAGIICNNTGSDHGGGGSDQL